MLRRSGFTYEASIVAIALSIAFLGSRSEPAAQVAPRNGLERLLAGERLPINAPANVAARRAANAAAPRRGNIPGRLIVKFGEGYADAHALSILAAQVGAQSITRSRFADFHVITLPEHADLVSVARRLATQPGVIYAEPDAFVHSTYVPNDPDYQFQWNLQKLDMERVWDINFGGSSSVTVAVIDTGVAYLDVPPFRQAPDLAGVNFVTPHDFIWETDRPFDLDGHGTHVTGTIAQRTGNGMGVAGMAFNVSVMPIKVISGEWDAELGAPNIGSASVVAEAVHYAADNGAKVINMSLGIDVPVTPVRDAIDYAIGKGAVVVVSAGNSGDIGSPEDFPAAYAKDIQGLIAVAALDVNFNRAYYSNSNDYVEVAAPGGDTTVDLNNDGYVDGVLQQTINQDLVFFGVFNEFRYEFFQGTSMAAPHVSGLAALLISQGVTDPKAVEAVIERFATDIGPSGRDNDTGFGVINPRATIRGLGISK